MAVSPRTKTKQFRVERSGFEQTVLLLQGGGALGSYQAGVYQALAEAEFGCTYSQIQNQLAIRQLAKAIRLTVFAGGE